MLRGGLDWTRWQIALKTRRRLSGWLRINLASAGALTPRRDLVDTAQLIRRPLRVTDTTAVLHREKAVNESHDEHAIHDGVRRTRP